MNRPVVIVDPRSSGIELAPAFKARGIPAIGVTFKPLRSRLGFGTEVQTSDFVATMSEQSDLVDVLRKFNPLAILPGAEAGVPLANSLSAALTPQFSNDSGRTLNRLHKAQMQNALAQVGVPSLRTLSTSSESEVLGWLEENKMANSALVIKPPVSAGSEKVFHVPAGGDWKKPFNMILTEASNITGRVNDSVVVQEQAATGPRLIESVPRMTGGPVVRLAREATGSSQADKLVEIFVEGDVRSKDYSLRKSVVSVFLKSPQKGIISNAEAFDDVATLPTLFSQFIWFRNGDPVPQTVDYLTSIGIIALAGDRNSIFSDYKKIREMESKLVIQRTP